MNPKMLLIIAVCMGGALAIVTFTMARLRKSMRRFREEFESHVQMRMAELATINQALRTEIAERNQAEEALHASEEHFRQIFWTIPIPVWLYDLETLRFLEVNDMAVEKYGYSREEFLAMAIGDLEPWEKEETLRRRADLTRGRKHAMQGRKHQAKQGRILDVEVSAHLTSFGGTAAGLVAVQDVSQRKQMEVELRHAQKLEAVGGLAAGIAHEINTPVQFVGDNIRFLQDAFKGIATLVAKYEEVCERLQQGNSGSELLGEVGPARQAADWEYAREEIPKALEQALDGINRVAKIVRAMKEFSHVNQTTEKTAADLNRALESTLVVARNELKYVANVNTNYGVLPPVTCHLGDLNQVFLNLLINAAHAIGDVVKGTGSKGEITVRTRQDGDWVEVAIGDTGTGIPEEIQGKIFEPFFTTKEVGKGTGQGLALARAVVVEKHGGTLTFETEPGRGTTFHVRLPVSSVAAPREAVAS